MGRVRVDAVRVASTGQEEGDEAGLVVVHRREERRGPVGMTRVHQRGLHAQHPLHRRFVGAINGAVEFLDLLLQQSRAARRLAGAPQRVQMRAELAPACEAVLPCHRELRVGELGRGIAALQLPELFLGKLLQVLEVGTIRQGHDAPSFHSARCPRYRAEGGDVDSHDRWVQPFTRTVSRLDG